MAAEEDPDRIYELLRRSDDSTLVILRGHLVIEAFLRDILDRVCRSPEELLDARFTFHQVYTLTRAIVGRQDEPVWAFIKRLNEVRNKTAHHLEPGDLDEIIGSMVERLWEKNLPGLLEPHDTPLGRFRRALMYAVGYLTAIRGAVGLRRAYEPQSPGGV